MAVPPDSSESDADRLTMTESTRREIAAMGLDVPRTADGELIEVVPDEDAREMLIVCLRADGPSYFDDDVIGECDRCHMAVRHRPHVPLGVIPICMICFAAERAQQGKPGIEDLLRNRH